MSTFGKTTRPRQGGMSEAGSSSKSPPGRPQRSNRGEACGFRTIETGHKERLLSRLPDTSQPCSPSGVAVDGARRANPH